MYCVWIHEIGLPDYMDYMAGEALGIDEDFETLEDARKWCDMFDRYNEGRAFAYPLKY